MPPFRNERLLVDPRFDGEVLHELRDIGHGHTINIVDASYDIPRGARIVKFPGSSADALLGIARLIPLEGHIIFMDRDIELETQDPELKDITAQAQHDFQAIPRILLDEEGISIDIDGRERFGDGGFYVRANNTPNSLFVRTIDELPFACASIQVGHSQRTGS